VETGALKMTDMKMTENAGHEIAGHEIARHDKNIDSILFNFSFSCIVMLT